jgi:hypothetical protein
MAYWTSSGLVNLGSLADAIKKDLRPTFTVSLNAGIEGSVTGRKRFSSSSARASAFSGFF